MLNIFARALFSRVVDPMGGRLARSGIGPDIITLIGTTGTVVSALWFFPRDQLLAGTIAITGFVLLDVLDGAVARARGSGTPWGTVLDATCDRIADGALFAGLTWWCFGLAHDRLLAAAALLCLVSAQVISYIKARAAASGLSADGGIVERAERYLITLVGAGLAGLGVRFALDVALWVLAGLQLVTITQRMLAVRRDSRGAASQRSTLADPGCPIGSRLLRDAPRTPSRQPCPAGADRVGEETPIPEPAPPSPSQPPLPAVVVNPRHITDLPTLHAQITSVCAELSWAPPLWLLTTAEDPGGGQAKAALAAGAAVVLACGGDGTNRHIAQVLAGSGTALALLPTGTANLLARNLAIVPEDTAHATRIALSGTTRTIDVGRVLIDDCAEEQVFLVMTGMGFDAAIMTGAPEQLKARLGSLAYVVSGARALMAPRVPVTLAVDGRSESPRQVRTVVVGNCGKLLGGLTLLPAAKLDDGLLDVVAISPRSLLGWLAVTARVLTRRRRGHRIVQHWQGRTIILSAQAPQQAQLDGDPIGDVRAMRMRIDPGALLIRV
ncbi:MAG: CDP-alcohol phosphatidyltransferase family protein [Pseudonocardiales bacterium]|nr:CDP-alcohol phosphatidyltransferase family protein [Pseudonocardiales bacterium]MBV9029693.1 CDP-alcohol phosphatidyltransferase family protein [Pseudonocardiales bacterium]MBW0010854.1 CDP-alcohol phosphatidyltransferase family protein [Pseudonocardiales bacterium]